MGCLQVSADISMEEKRCMRLAWFAIHMQGRCKQLQVAEMLSNREAGSRSA
jgi:hypothetical protein